MHLLWIRLLSILKDMKVRDFYKMGKIICSLHTLPPKRQISVTRDGYTTYIVCRHFCLKESSQSLDKCIYSRNQKNVHKKSNIYHKLGFFGTLNFSKISASVYFIMLKKADATLK